METICSYLKEQAAEEAVFQAANGDGIVDSPEDLLFRAIDNFIEGFSFEVMQFLITDENKDFVRNRLIKAPALN